MRLHYGDDVYNIKPRADDHRNCAVVPDPARRHVVSFNLKSYTIKKFKRKRKKNEIVT